ncbi:MAG: ABC transporter ATP-binding protein [Myxococcales bacterium]|nr:ABC transporter ATP-binding protein [Myxococcales bacterium]
MSDCVIQWDRATKRYRKTLALSDVSLCIKRGHVYGLVGRNGCGKSTLLRQVTGRILPDDGQCLTFGTPVKNLGDGELARLGYVDQEATYLEWLSVKDHVAYVGGYYRNWNHALVESLLMEFGIPGDKAVRDLSPGVRQQLGVILAMGHEPELLVFDEPAASMDPFARARFLDRVMEVVQDGNRTVVISSHLLSDIEKVADTIIIMDGGKVVAEHDLDTLRESYSRAFWGEPSLPDTPIEGVRFSRTDGSRTELIIHKSQDEVLGLLPGATFGVVTLEEILELELTRQVHP